VTVYEATPTDAVHLRFLVVRGLPLLVAVVPPVGRGAELTAALADRGLARIGGFLGVDLPRGARVGFVLDASELRLVDERDDTLLRAPREGIDDDWIAGARRLRGTMIVAVDELALTPEAAAPEVAGAVDERARAGSALGAIVGVVEERPTLPLLF
jgi:hypothetical protein